MAKGKRGIKSPVANKAGQVPEKSTRKITSR